MMDIDDRQWMTASIQRKDKKRKPKKKAPARDAFYKKISLVLTEYQKKKLPYSVILECFTTTFQRRRNKNEQFQKCWDMKNEISTINYVHNNRRDEKRIG